MTEYKQESDLEHARNRTNMYLGSLGVSTHWDYVFGQGERKGIIEYRQIASSNAATKCADEIIVNAIDECGKTRGGCDINFQFNEKTGEISVENTGSCIKIRPQRTTDGREMMSLQFLFGELRTSGNYNKVGEKRKTGGMYGLGATLVNLFCTVMDVETYDPDYQGGKYALQQFRDCLTRIEPLVLDDGKPEDRPFAKVSFILDWSKFEMDGRNFPRYIADLGSLIYMRAVQTSVWIYPNKVTWNGQQIAICMPRQLVQAHLIQGFGGDASLVKTIEYTMRADDERWDICVGIKDGSTRFEHVTLCNGIFTKSGGTHVERITDQIVDYCREPYLKMIKKHTKTKEPKLTNRENILKYLFLFMKCEMDRPDLVGQRKDGVDTPIEKYAKFKLSTPVLEEIWDRVCKFIDMDLLDKSAAESKTKKSRKKVKAKKYTPATLAGSIHSAKCGLFIGEGDSAVGMIDDLINSKQSAISVKTHGIYSIQGVPVNARKEISYKEDGRTGKKVKIRSKKLLDNERLNSLNLILGLDKSVTYRERSDFQKLPYSHIIIATDQDEDGKGNIRSQIKNYFQTEWPALYDQGFVRFLYTPVVRAYSKDGREKVHEFFSDSAYAKWRDSTADFKSRYEIRYYKGLAGHSAKEVDHMAANIHNMIVTCTSDATSEEKFRIYFDDDTSLRKTALRNAPVGTEIDYIQDGKLPVSIHLDTETLSFQRHNIRRHIRCAIDGFLPTTRKVFFGSRKHFAKQNKLVKIFQLAGYVAKHANYHNGNASIEGVITGMAQYFAGSNEFPLLRGDLSKTGSRKKGGTDAGSARYVDVKLNERLADAMFPPADDLNLPYTYYDGARAEPDFYVPVLAMAALESFKSPATGWASTLWARDFDAVYNYTMSKIHAQGVLHASRASPLDTPDLQKVGAEGDTKAETKDSGGIGGRDFPVSSHGTKHKTVTLSSGTVVSLGDYKVLSSNIVVITEFPIRKWNEHTIKGNPKASEKKKAERKERKDAKAKGGGESKGDGTAGKKSGGGRILWDDDPNIVQIVDTTNGNDINVQIEFVDGFLSKILAQGKTAQGIDPLIEYLGLKQSLKSNINLVDKTGSVVEYQTYVQVVDDHFPIRKEFYRLQLLREQILADVRLIMYENMLRYAEELPKYNFSKMSNKQQDEFLREHKYQTVHKAAVNTPEVADMKTYREGLLSGQKASYGYLTSMNGRATNAEGIEKIRKLIADEKKTIADLAREDIFPGARYWIRDMERLRDIVKIGKTQGWDAWDTKHKW